MIRSIKAVLPNRLDPTTGEPTEINLEMFNPYKTGLAVTSVTNTGPIKSNITMDDWATVPGANKNTMHRSYRNIVMKLRYMEERSIEETRHLTYRYFPVEEDITLQFTTDTGVYCIDGTIEDNGVPMWVKAEESTVSVICGDPFFYALGETTKSFVRSIPQFHFFNPSPSTGAVDPFMPSDRFHEIIPTGQNYPIQLNPNPLLVGRKIRITSMIINNPSSLPVGLRINMTATGTVLNPRFVNLTTNQGFYLKGEFYSQAKIVIDTRSGHKRVLNGDGSNAINKMDLKSKWIVLQPGDNTIKFSAESGTANMDVSLAIRPIYEGI